MQTSEARTTRLETLYGFLGKIGARQQCGIGKISEGTFQWEYQGWEARGRPFIVVLLRDEEGEQEGFEVFIPASRRNNVQLTLEELEHYVYS